MPQFTLVNADIRDSLRDIPDGTFDTVISDAPYGLSITKTRSAANWDASGIAFDAALWAELRRVAKPGGLLAAFGHPRTSHRQTVALEDAGWQVFDTVAWVKSHGYQAGNRSLQKELRKTGAEGLADEYDGFGTHLSPAYESITLARNLGQEGSLVQAIAGGGAGGLNHDATRVQETDWAFRTAHAGVSLTVEDRSRRPGQISSSASWAIPNRTEASVPHLGGRLPGNLVLEHSERCAEGACEEGCAVAEIDLQGRAKYARGREPASRFFTRLRYSPRATASERPPTAGEFSHPTVKPQQLLEWLTALIVKPNSVVLDVFAGSGAVSEAALRAGAGAVTAVEREASYVEMIRARIEKMV